MNKAIDYKLVCKINSSIHKLQKKRKEGCKASLEAIMILEQEKLKELNKGGFYERV